ncbi:hypothetical protein D3C81_2107790 [compost metagenome]
MPRMTKVSVSQPRVSLSAYQTEGWLSPSTPFCSNCDLRRDQLPVTNRPQLSLNWRPNEPEISPDFSSSNLSSIPAEADRTP